MNENQKNILKISAVIIALMLIFPPVENRGFSAGYGFLFDTNYSINLELLILQWIAVGVVAAIWFLTSKNDLNQSLFFMERSDGAVMKKSVRVTLTILSFIFAIFFLGVLNMMMPAKGAIYGLLSVAVVGGIPLASWRLTGKVIKRNVSP